MGMHRHFHSWAAGIALAALLLIVSACGASSNSSSSSHSNSSSTTISPTQLLQKTTTAMKSLKAAHTVLKSTSTVNAGTASGTSTGTSTTGATSTPMAGSSPQQATVTVSGSGDEVFPNQASLNFMVNTGSSSGTQGTSVSEIVTNQKLYIKSQKGQWYVFTPSSTGGGNPFASANVSNYNNLLNIAQKGKITDDGYQTISGQKLRHLTVNFSQSNLKDLLSTMGQIPSNMSSAQQQQFNRVLSSIKVQQATLDLWINESNSYVYQEQFKLNLASNGASSAGSSTPTTTTGGTQLNFNDNTNTMINYSKFNESITITPPANATPTNNLLTALQ